ncbi:GNAT family N-acetyltransferase [Micromonospora sp. NPDC049282]|uniref:GNAT family N-acetyltransferase n=1 Tax=Micromonospora sp. NPDC049282 TaxID=3364269 RepID=UPI00371B32AF
MPQPILRTDRLLMVPLADRHLELEVRLDSDAEVLRYLFSRPHTRDEVVDYHARRMAQAAKVDGLGFWMAFGSDDCGRDSIAPASEDEGEFVGLMMLPPAHGPDQPDDPTVAELGYRLVRRHWRKGLASEASRGLLRHAFDTVGQRLVIAQTMTVNVGSRGVMEAVGMRYVRTYVPEWDEPLPGADQGEVEYEMTREMWQAS